MMKPDMEPAIGQKSCFFSGFAAVWSFHFGFRDPAGKGREGQKGMEGRGKRAWKRGVEGHGKEGHHCESDR